jgi:hypothetical protein
MTKSKKLAELTDRIVDPRDYMSRLKISDFTIFWNFIRWGRYMTEHRDDFIPVQLPKWFHHLWLILRHFDIKLSKIHRNSDYLLTESGIWSMKIWLKVEDPGLTDWCHVTRRMTTVFRELIMSWYVSGRYWLYLYSLPLLRGIVFYFSWNLCSIWKVKHVI